MTSLYFVLVILAFLLCLYAAFSDYKSLTIPNWISLALIGIYGLVIFISPQDINWIGGLLTGIAVLVIGFVLYATGLFGAGDIKLLTALGLWAGPELILSFLFAVAIAGGFLVFAFLIRNAIQQMADSGRFLSSLKLNLRSKLKIPYGIAIALGSTVVFYAYINAAGAYG